MNETWEQRRARVREEAANGQAFAANIIGTCSCDCHTTDSHCDTCCQEKLCDDCIHYAIGG